MAGIRHTGGELTRVYITMHSGVFCPQDNRIMAFQYEAECSCCDYKSRFIWPLWACYQWPSSSTLELAQRVIWCNACNTVSIGEAVIPLETMEKLAGLEPVQSIGKGWDSRTKIGWKQNEIDAALDYARYPRYTQLYEHLMHSKKWGLKQSVILYNTLNNHLQWRRQRVSLAHCLHCGSPDFINFDLDDRGEPKPEAHPGCVGVISIMPRHKTRSKSRPDLWTTEGEPITSKQG